jgi:hypothetical protein
MATSADCFALIVCGDNCSPAKYSFNGYSIITERLSLRANS